MNESSEDTQRELSESTSCERLPLAACPGSQGHAHCVTWQLYRMFKFGVLTL